MKSDFAILDIKSGRKKLLRRITARERIEVVIRGTISSAWGSDDGVSQEFTVDVTDVSEVAPKPEARS